MTAPQPYPITATSHWPNYLPEYVAADRGFFADEGLAVRRWVPEPWDGVLDDLDSGRARVALGGIWVPSMFHRRGREYRAFAQLNGRNPKAVVTREPRPDFDWPDLAGRTVLVPGAGGTAPYVHSAGLMRRAGLDRSRVRFVRDLSGSMLTELFLAGMGDALITDTINATQLAATGRAHVALRVDEVGGPMPNSVYYATPAELEHEDGGPWRFCRALRRAYDWIAEHPVAELSDLLARTWPALHQPALIGVVDELRALGLWSDIRIDPAAYDTWQQIMAEEGLVDAPIPYPELVDPRPAAAAYASPVAG